MATGHNAFLPTGAAAEPRRLLVGTTSHNAYDLARLRKGIKPFRLHFFPRLRSTSDHAATLRRRRRLFGPSIVLTGHQLAGRGRGHHVWWSGPGGITVTFVLPIDDRLAPHHLPLVAGVAVRAAAAELTGVDAIQLKWPNDLLFEGRKLAGLLCERIDNADLVGLGLNVNVNVKKTPSWLARRISSLSEIAGRELSMTDTLICVTSHLRDAVARATHRPFAAVLHEYDANHALIGRRVTVIPGHDMPAVAGLCKGLDPMGRLLLKDRKQMHHILAGEVAVR